ncbi:hypothetical protein N7495_002040 [Penicillium taxi]|uniref:uncharacterized protein n=1 Tax=Penicillium taxi TaxID=168475 RepID=UPI002544F49C|nr:uncharacterized protein N7495_002040 [Penicillium taxi]KAJ5901512.1 hypothetical protein N7495_002040 [Penicillium taxi]
MWTFTMLIKRLTMPEDDESSSLWDKNPNQVIETESSSSTVTSPIEPSILYPSTPTSDSTSISITLATTTPFPDTPELPISTSTTSQQLEPSAIAQQTTNTFSPSSQKTPNATSSQSTTSISSEKTTTSTATSTADAASAAPGAYSGGGSTTNKLAIALPIAIVGVLAILAFAFFALRRRRRHRNALPSYEFAKSQTTAMSASELVSVPRTVDREPVVSELPRLPVLNIPVNVPDERRSEMGSALTPASASTPNDAQVGVAVAVPVNHRLSTTTQDMHRTSRPLSVPGAAVMPVPETGTETRLLSNGGHGHGRDDDAVSVISDEQRGDHDFDDMSSVSSFNDDEHAGGDHNLPFH